MIRSINLHWAVVALIAIALVAGTVPQALATVTIGAVGTGAGFEDNDGDLAPSTGATPIAFDWNSFAPLTWTGTAPFQTATKTGVTGPNGSWRFTALTDAVKSNADTSFAGGVKQDDNCAKVGTNNNQNKTDLERAYFATTTTTSGQNVGHIYLMLAFARNPLNTVSSSTHVGFEFNQGSTQCAGSALVSRVAGDMLIVYDFAGGTAVPTLTLRRWVLTGACEISSDTPPCWGTATTLPAGQAEAAVNTGAGGLPTSVSDSLVIGSGSPAATTAEILGTDQFGEAGIDLTAAGVFPATPTQCTSFATAFAVSRSSGNSGQAQMEDLVGPGPFKISNCGQLVVKKVTDPSPDPTNTSFSFTVNGPANQPQGTTLPKSFSLVNGGTNTTTVFAGSTYSAAETVPASWGLTSASCDNGSGTLTGSTISNISVSANEVVTCTFNDKLQQGAIKISKTSTKTTALAGATFSITGPNNFSTSVTTGALGTACVDHLAFGTYSVQETAAPKGYSIDDTTAHSVVVGTSSVCGDGNEATFSATDTPLTDLTVTVASEAVGGTKSSITCVNSLNANIGNSPQPATGTGDPETVTATGLKPGTYTCTVVVVP